MHLHNTANDKILHTQQHQGISVEEVMNRLTQSISSVGRNGSSLLSLFLVSFKVADIIRETTHKSKWGLVSIVSPQCQIISFVSMIYSNHIL